MSTKDEALSVQGERFVRAWLNIDRLPGIMMVSNHGKFGPIPATTSGLVTTSPKTRAEWLACGTPAIEVWLAPQPEPRKPLTEAEMRAEFSAVSDEFSTAYDLSQFRLGVRFAERAHGIGSAPSFPQVSPAE